MASSQLGLVGKQNSRNEETGVPDLASEVTVDDTNLMLNTSSAEMLSRQTSLHLTSTENSVKLCTDEVSNLDASAIDASASCLHDALALRPICVPDPGLFRRQSPAKKLCFFLRYNDEIVSICFFPFVGPGRAKCIGFRRMV